MEETTHPIEADTRTDHGGEAAGSKQDPVPPPFIMSEALPVVPGKLVKRIRKGEYIDMAELLKDNVEAERGKEKQRKWRKRRKRRKNN